MRRVTVQAVLAHRWMVPEKRTAFFSMAGVTHVIDGMVRKHLAPLTAMRIVAGSAADLHIVQFGAKQVGGPLVQSLSLFWVTGETGLFHRSSYHHSLWQPAANYFRDFGIRLVSKVDGHCLN